MYRPSTLYILSYLGVSVITTFAEDVSTRPGPFKLVTTASTETPITPTGNVSLYYPIPRKEDALNLLSTSLAGTEFQIYYGALGTFTHPDNTLGTLSYNATTPASNGSPIFRNQAVAHAGYDLIDNQFLAIHGIQDGQFVAVLPALAGPGSKAVRNQHRRAPESSSRPSRPFSSAEPIMARGPKKHLKRLAAPSSWMLDKLSGTYAPRPSPGPHKLLTAITAQRLIKVDGKVRTDNTYPTGFMDVVSIEKSGEHFRLLYDVKGRFVIHRITAEEATYKLLKVRKMAIGARGVPYIVTHDGRTIRYPDPNIKVNDTVKFDLTTGKITDYVKFDTGNLVMITGGRNMGRAGTITHRERHIGGFDIVHVKDVLDRTFATRISNIFVIGEGSKAWISLPKGKGTKLTISEERDQRRRQRAAEAA
ncbi:ribosomal family S4e [Ceratobasidium sp. AG-Ba]|nr:ribosomal family S4e [Ceratobasidium sp. AG-Ba]QRW03237.1 ribosomal family S4e [Ceratobasidium sp. AG-Ba]